MAGPEGNPELPTDPSKRQDANVRALQHLSRVVEDLTNTLVSQRAGQGLPPRDPFARGVQGGSEEAASQAHRETLAAQPPGKASPHASFVYGNNPTPEAGPLVPLAAISPLQAIKAMRNRAPGEGRIEGAFNIRKRQPPAQGAGELSPSASIATGEGYDQEKMQTNLGSSITETGSRRGPRSSILGNMSQEETEKMEREGFWIPQFGEWQLDTKLRMARDWAGLAALRHPESTAGKLLGGASELANYGYAQAAKIQVAKNTFQKLQAYGTGAMTQGAELGYSPQGGIGPSNIAGFRNPLAYLTSPAGRQGLGMNLDAWTMARLGTGMSLTQSKEIYNSLAGMGFSNQEGGFLGLTTGGDLNNIATRFMAPLVRQGVKPEVAAQFTESLKTGQVSISELTNSLQGLTDVAKETRQTVTQTAAGIQEYAQAAVGLGATPTQGYRGGLSFSTVTGLPAQVGAQSLSNPILQAKAMARYGVLPENMGLLPGSAVSTNITKTMEELMPDFSHLPPVRDPETGEVIASGETQAFGLLSQRLGIPVQQLRAMWAKRKYAAKAGRVDRILEPSSQWNQGITKDEKELVIQRESTHHYKQKLAHQEELLKGAYTGANLQKELEKLRSKYNRHEGEFAGGGWVNLTPEQAAKLRKGDWKHGIMGSDQVAHWMKQIGVDPKEVAEFAHAKVRDQSKIEKRIMTKWGKRDISSTGEVTSGGVTIGLTPYARKFFKLKGGSEEKAEERNAGTSLPTSTPASAGVPSQYGE